MPGLDNVDYFSLVKDHTCAVRSRELLCWGSNSHVQPPERSYINGKLGPEARELPYSAAPKPVGIPLPVLYVGMGAEATYAVTQGGLIYAWGENDRFQLGIESQEKIVWTPTAVKVATVDGLVPLATVTGTVPTAGSDQCVLMANRHGLQRCVSCWGTDDWGELGAGTMEDARATHQYPVAVRALPVRPIGWFGGKTMRAAMSRLAVAPKSGATAAPVRSGTGPREPKTAFRRATGRQRRSCGTQRISLQLSLPPTNELAWSLVFRADRDLLVPKTVAVVLVLAGCNDIAGIDAIPCAPGCRDKRRASSAMPPARLERRPVRFPRRSARRRRVRRAFARSSRQSARPAANRERPNATRDSPAWEHPST